MKLSFHARAAVAAAITAIVSVGMLAPATAALLPPAPDATLYGTWKNLDPNSRGIVSVRIDKDPAGTGSVAVEAFGSCHPTACDWGHVAATVYGSNVSAKTGTSFQTNQRFSSADREWSRTQLLGHVTKTKAGLRLTIRGLTAFTDNSGRKNYTQVATFARTDKRSLATSGTPATGYVRGAAPSIPARERGSWVPTTPSNGLAKVVVGGTLANPTVSAFGACSPIACAWGRVKATAFGATVSDKTGSTLWAPYSFSFKNSQLLITFKQGSTKSRDRITVTAYSEFLDGSGRSNYVSSQSFKRG